MLFEQNHGQHAGFFLSFSFLNKVYITTKQQVYGFYALLCEFEYLVFKKLN